MASSRAVQSKWKLIMSDEFEHYGIKGMRWGVRRANPSGGSLVAKKVEAKLPRKRISKGDLVPKKKNSVKHMSNQELQAAINRIELEKKYNKLTKKETIPQKIGKFLYESSLNAVKKETNAYIQRELGRAIREYSTSGNSKKKRINKPATEVGDNAE